MVLNSDFILLHKQSPLDRKAWVDLLGLSDEEATYIDESVRPGEGLLVAGAARVPIKDDFPKGELYEESLDEDVITTSLRAIASCDMLIVGGTSLVVYPAAGLIRYFQGDQLVICNLQPTPQDSAADLVCACDIAKAFDW